MSKEKVQLVNELHKPARKNFPRRRTIIKGLNDLWQIDLAEMRPYARENKGFKFIMVVINCFSKYMWTCPLKTKTGDAIVNSLMEILKKHPVPKNLQTDQGKEFFNAKFHDLMKKYKINHYNTFSVKKAAIAERAIRTLKVKLYKYFSLHGTYKWIDVLPKITQDYNNTKHRTTGYKPSEVDESNQKIILNRAYSYLKIRGPQKFKVGDNVRISKAKCLFEKGYTPNWSTELFKISKINITNPVTYLLEDFQGNPISGAFYEEELQKTANPDIYLVEKVLKRKANKLFVKWLGLDSKQNSWIDKRNIV